MVMSIEKFTKVNDNTIKVELTETHSFSYDIDYLVSQKKIIQEEREKFLVEKDEALKKLDNLIKECKKLGIKSIIEKRNK